jgi:hypothetical protein
MSMDMQEQVARIQRMQEETRKFAAEMHKLTKPARPVGPMDSLVCRLALPECSPVWPWSARPLC